MAKKPETTFRTNTVRPALLGLPNTAIFPIQQRAIKGDPDFLLCINGLFVGLELKDVAEEPDPLQYYKLDSIFKAKGIALVARPDNWEDIFQFLSEMACSEIELPINYPEFKT